MQIELSPRQRATIATAATVVATAVILAALAGVLFLLGWFFGRFAHVFLPVAVAGVIALVVKPYFDWLASFRAVPPVLAVVLVFLSILVPLAALIWFFGAVVAHQLGDLIDQLPEWWRSASDAVRERWPKIVAFWTEHPLGVRLRESLAGQQGSLVGSLQSVGTHALSAGRSVLHGIGAVLAWVVLPVYVAFFLLGAPKLESREFLPFLKPQTRDDVAYLAREFVNILVAFFRGQLLIAVMQGVLYAIGFTAVGLRYGLVLGLLLGFLNVIPYLGSLVGLGIALPLAMFQTGGGGGRLVAVLVVFVAVQLIEGYLLTPKIMGDRTGLHPMVIIIAVFFWGSALGGISGMILGIPLTAFFVVFWRLARERYIGEIV